MIPADTAVVMTITFTLIYVGMITCLLCKLRAVWAQRDDYEGRFNMEYGARWALQQQYARLEAERQELQADNDRLRAKMEAIRRCCTEEVP